MLKYLQQWNASFSIIPNSNTIHRTNSPFIFHLKKYCVFCVLFTGTKGETSVIYAEKNNNSRCTHVVKKQTSSGLDAWRECRRVQTFIGSSGTLPSLLVSRDTVAFPCSTLHKRQIGQQADNSPALQRNVTSRKAWMIFRIPSQRPKSILNLQKNA